MLILHEGAEPGPREVTELVRVVERETGVDLLGVPVATVATAEASEFQARFLLTRLEKDSDRDSVTTYAAEAVAGRRVVAVTWSVERNPWVRTTIPAHLAKGAGLRLAMSSGWARLTSEPALGFVASADDGMGRRFPEVHVVVSLLAETSPRRIRRLMPGGYLHWVDGVFATAGARLGTVDVAHWLVCVNGRRRTVHLAYLTPRQRGSPLLPWELLSGAEKRGGVKFA